LESGYPDRRGKCADEIGELVAALPSGHCARHRPTPPNKHAPAAARHVPGIGDHHSQGGKWYIDLRAIRRIG
jgi:hypothetical protein